MPSRGFGEKAVPTVWGNQKRAQAYSQHYGVLHVITEAALFCMIDRSAVKVPVLSQVRAATETVEGRINQCFPRETLINSEGWDWPLK